MGTSSESSEYVLSTDRVELERLGLQNRLWGDAAHALWRQAGITVGSRVLDVGCGPGYATMDLAQIVGRPGRVFGVDESGSFIEELNRRAAVLGLDHASGAAGDAHDLGSVVPADEPPFDAAFIRWMLCFVQDPGAVLASVHDHLAPGGRVAVFDYFNYRSMTLAPREALFDKMCDAVCRSWIDRGGDPDVMGRVPGLLRDAGFTVTHHAVHQRIARPGETMWAWPTTFWESFLPRLVETGYLTADEHAGILDLWARVSADPSRFMALPPVWEIVATRD